MSSPTAPTSAAPAAPPHTPPPASTGAGRKIARPAASSSAGSISVITASPLLRGEGLEKVLHRGLAVEVARQRPEKPLGEGRAGDPPQPFRNRLQRHRPLLRRDRAEDVSAGDRRIPPHPDVHPL